MNKETIKQLRARISQSEWTLKQMKDCPHFIGFPNVKNKLPQEFQLFMIQVLENNNTLMKMLHDVLQKFLDITGDIQNG
jgi:hypothetical protein